jgi:hypothetical protein
MRLTPRLGGLLRAPYLSPLEAGEGGTHDGREQDHD